jgi:hypothetical protein
VPPSRFVLAVLILILAGSLPSYAQTETATASRADSSLYRVLTRISEHGPRSVRLTSHATGRVQGTSLELRGDSIYVVSDQGVRALLVGEVDSVWVQGTAALLVGILTAVPCAIFGLMVGTFIGGDPDSQGSSGKAIVEGLIGAIGGGFLCGVVGAGFGSLIPQWRLEYARPALTSP